ncbi:MAG: TIGR02757 family protein [Myxococcota bacterium]
MVADLAPFLEDAYARYADPRHLPSDPLSVPWRYEDPRDRELVGFVAAGLAFGNVKAILRSVDRALAPLGDRPARALDGIDRAAAARWAEGFNHRWVFAPDLANLYVMLGGALRDAGGLEPLFAEGMAADAPDVRPGAASLVDGLRSHLDEDEASRRGTRYLLPNPTGQGAAKRLHMFLRWMVRDRDVDLGLWRSAGPRQLLIPLDTHVARISRYIGLTDRKTSGRATVQEITGRLRAIDPEDPIRFDFAISRLGILRDCPTRRAPACCGRCPLLQVCRL